ncbi:MAG: hypothetical protein KGM43_17995 [Planctomycetota bacterium]|nr:hypothetical protein [Planctomycetota bacterium]
MPTVFHEGEIRFEFSDEWEPQHYDKHPDREPIKRLPETKSVDFAAIKGEKLYLIEVTDYRNRDDRLRDQIGAPLAIEVAQKVRDTIAGIVAAQHRGNVQTWDRFTKCLLTPEPAVQVVLWMEHEHATEHDGRNETRAYVMSQELKKKLKWLTAKVLVTSMDLCGLDGVKASDSTSS